MMAAARTDAAPLAHYRDLEPGDVSFLFSSWLKSYGKALEREGKRRFFTPTHEVAAHHDVIARLLQRGRVLLACDPRAPKEVWSWCCFEAKAGTVVHYVYTRQLFRRFGFAAELLRRATSGGGPVTHTHETQAGRGMCLVLRSTYAPEAAQ